MNRGGTAVDTKTPLKDGGNAGELGRATKSGRKVKRPAHFDDSPDAKRSASVVVAAKDEVSPKRNEVQEVAKKSARKTLLKNQPEDVSPQRNGAPVPEVEKKSARKTLNKQETREEEPEPTQRSHRKTMTVMAKEDTPEPEDIKKSARKTLPKSAVKKPSEPTPETPTSAKQEVESSKKSTKKADVEKETPAGPGISRTGRKIKIPAHLKEFEDVVVPSPKKELAEKATVGRKSLAPPAVAEKEEIAPKTPGRGRSLAAPRKAPEPEAKAEPKTPRFTKSSASLEEVEQDDPLALPSSVREVKSPRKDKQTAKSPPKALKPAVDPLKEDEDVPVKTSRRGKSLAAPEAPKSPPAKKENPPAKTPSKRGKSMAASVPVSPPEKAPKTPKQAASKSIVEDLATAEPMSRSGRKIKPKKYFGEFDEEEPAVIVAAPAVKVSSPVKAVAKSSPVAKKEPVPAKMVGSPVKAVVKSSPVAVKVASPVARKESPKVASPAKRHLHPVAAEKAMELPKKRAKLADPKSSSDELPEKKLDEISPNTEERLITKRGVNDHHHTAKEDSPAKATEESTKPSSPNDKNEQPTKDDKENAEEHKPKRGRKPLAAKLEEAPVVAEECKPADEEQQQTEKPKRGRKTLPALSTPESSDEAEEEPAAPAKAPKTPVARRMTTAALVSAPSEDVGSSRSGRKIKPKKFFGEDEPASATKPKPAASLNGAGSATGGGRGRRKTLAAELDKADKAEEVTTVAPQAEVKECPSREEILAVVGVVDTVGQIEEEHQEPQQTEVAEEQTISAMAVEEEQEAKKDDEPTPMEEDLPQESEQDPEPITTPIVGTESEEAVAEDVPQEVDESEPIAEVAALATNGDCPTAMEPLPAEHQMESVDPEDVLDGDQVEGAVVPEEDEESTLQGTETVESTQEDFQELSIPQTSPRQAMIPEEAPESPAPLHEKPPAVMEESHPVVESEEVDATVPEVDAAEVIEESEQVETDRDDPVETGEKPSTVQETAAAVPVHESNQQHAEVSASSSFSEALRVEEESVEQGAAEPAKLDDSKEQHQYESVEFLEVSGTSTGATEQAVVEPLPVEHTNGHEEQSTNRITTPELEDDLDNTEAPPMDDLDDEREDELLEDAQEPQEATFSERDRDNESIIVIPDTPKPPKSQEFDEEFDLMDKSPVPQSSYATVGRVELHHSPVMKQEVPTTPRTPDSKPAKSSCSPDKPDDQEQADVPETEVIDITDSPITVLESKLHNITDGKPGSTTSTPLRMGSKMTAKDRLIQNSRKRSLSASDAEIIKKNVTFHSPANSTMLVDTIDERLKKKNESATKIPHGHRKRSHSEHKDVASQDGPKPSKISKLPNFKNIHQQQFNRMESIEEFHNRKVQRAKEILATSTVKSPAASALVRSAERPPLQKSSSLPARSPHKTGNGSSASSSYKPAVVRPLIPKPAAESHHKPLSDADRQEKRQKQFHATFKPKSQDGSGKDTPDSAQRVVEQSRHKQNQILKGVRTNKRFELMMKYRDAHE